MELKKLLFVVFLFHCMQTNAYSQTTYELNTRGDLIIGALSLGIGITPFFVSNKPDNIPDALNKNDVNSFDRSLMFSRNKPLDIISDNSAYAVALLPIISMMPNINEKNTGATYGIMYSEALLLTYGTVFTLKNAIIRYRPYMYADGVPSGRENDYYNSFPSGAASFAFLGATFLSTTFSHEFPKSKWKYPLIIGSYTLATGIASMRVLSGAHFLTDVFAGALIGSFYGWLIPYLHLKNDNDKSTIVPIGNGIIISFRF
jgi:membrane-associated phospholipid phosphatase